MRHCRVGHWTERDKPNLPGNLRWVKQGMKVLGVFLGSEEFEKKNCEGVVEKVCARLYRWKWLLPQLSYRGRVLIVNNLPALAPGIHLLSSLVLSSYRKTEPPITRVGFLVGVSPSGEKRLASLSRRW